ncbi:hypothetical protein U1Q18_019621 [Sarracenia purpurea var. burkii]
MELESDKYCKLGGSPKTVLPSPRCRPRSEKRSIEGKPECTHDLLSLEERFTEINFHCYRSSSCKNIPSRTSGLEANEVLKRGSVYQSSGEVRKMKKSGGVVGRRKIEFSRTHPVTFPLGIVDSLCSSDEDCLFMEQKGSSVSTDNVVSSERPSEIPLNSNSRDHCSAENVQSEKIENPKLHCDPIVSPINEGNGLCERDDALTLHKSLSAKLALPHSPSQSESDSSRPSSPRTRFSPIRKMFDPFTKSKSRRSPLGSASGPSGLRPTQLASMRRNNTLRKSLLNDFSNTWRSPDLGTHSVKKDLCNSAVSCLPAHLHGFLKLENKQGVPFFEFSSKFPEDAFVARRWKADNALKWVYTFHNRRKRNKASGYGLKEWNKESSVVGQMHVSCYLCTEFKDSRTFDNSMVAEFVLYDVVGNPNQSPDVRKPLKVSKQNFVENCELDDLQLKHAIENCNFDSPIPHPWASTDLHLGLEIAAIVIQVPFEKRESLRYKGGDAKSEQPHTYLLDLSAAEGTNAGIPDFSSPTKVDVVIPTGNHSLPCTEDRGPSPLLDRWRMGGGCDCGGWDMACPLTVFGNPDIQSAEDRPLTGNQQPLELFVRGAKENTPALTMTVIEEGRYSVDFHAQLSALQAFSICVAILHCTEASIAIKWERDKQSLQCNSLRVFIEEEVKSLIEAVMEKEERKFSKRTEEIPPSFKLNPPFSPIARV